MASLECAKNGVLCFDELKFQRNKGSYMTCGEISFFQQLLISRLFYISVVLFCFVSFRLSFLTFDIFSGTHVRTGSYAPTVRSHSGSLFWRCISLHDAASKSDIGTSHISATSPRLLYVYRFGSHSGKKSSRAPLVALYLLTWRLFKIWYRNESHRCDFTPVPKLILVSRSTLVHRVCPLPVSWNKRREEGERTGR